jgi:hypothetical protein
MSSIMTHNPEHTLLLAVLQANQDALLNTDTYAAARNICDMVTWIDDGTDIRLVRKTDVTNIHNLADIPNVHLSMIVHISEQDCFVMADSAWQGPSQIAPTFGDIKLTCTGSAPPFPDVYNDFFGIVRNLSEIIRMAAITHRHQLD